MTLKKRKTGGNGERADAENQSIAQIISANCNLLESFVAFVAFCKASVKQQDLNRRHKLTKGLKQRFEI
jgi:hypothetical protein